MTDQELIEACYREALLCLRENSTPAGILAALPTLRAERRNYTAIFGRDAAICALACAVSGEPKLVASARASLLTLAAHQARNGQIPKYVKPDLPEVDFWYAGCIDATLWWLIAVSRLNERLPDPEFAAAVSEKVRRALSWLECQEHQNWYLLQQNEASDWADIMPRSGFVLYSNALWYWVKRLYDLPSAGETRSFANLLLAPFSGDHPPQRRVRLLRHFVRNRCRPSPFFLSFVDLSRWGDELDIFGNLLAFLVGLSPPSCAEGAVNEILRLKANCPYPIRVVGTPIEPGSHLWRGYMERHRQNLPWQYHNGGIWPFVGGFWVLLLARLGKRERAAEELAGLARANRVNDWEFNEWFHGQSGKPMGMVRQSWNAALFVLAYRAQVLGDTFPF